MERITPEVDAVQAQVEAYNEHDLRWFVACYAPDAEIVEANGRVIAHGHDEIRNTYAVRFAQGVHVQILHRTQVGQFVVDEELVTGIRDTPVHAVAAYWVIDGLIVRVIQLRD